MQAFPKDSLNNAIGGSGPLNKRADHSTLMGQHTDEAFKEWSTVPAEPKTGALFDPMARNSILHGDESMGLGTSTFLEGAPAARKDIQRHEEERAQDATDGLQRKKSLAQRIRSINRGPREYGSSGRMSNPDGTNGSGLRRSPTDIPSSNGGQAGNGDRNPFFNEFETGKGSEDKISVRRADAAEESPSPTRLERRATTDGTVDDVGRSAGGLLARVKSLKGGKRAVRPAPPNAVGESSVSPMAIPGAVI